MNAHADTLTPSLSRSLAIHIRWMINRDMPDVMAIERASFADPWTQADFSDRLRQRNAIGMVAEDGDDLVGYMVYELHRERIELLNLAVHPGHRRRCIGAAMLHKLQSKLSPDRRQTVECCVVESNLQAQVFLRSLGFLAIDTWHGYYSDDQAAYRFQFHHNWLTG